MASTWSSLKFELIGTGEQSGTWGTTTNANIGDAIEQAIGGKADITMSSTSETLTLTDTTALQNARALYLNLTGTPGGAATLNVPAVEKAYIVKNGTTGGYAVTVKVSGQTGVSVPNGKTMVLYDNGTDVVDAITHLSSVTLGSALPLASGGTGAALTDPNADRILFWDDSAGAMAFLTAGSGLSISGTTISTTDAGGTVTSVGLTMPTGFSVANSPVTTAGTLAVTTSLSGVLKGSGGGFSAATAGTDYVAPGGALGTPSSGTLTNCTGLPLTSGITGTLAAANGGTGNVNGTVAKVATTNFSIEESGGALVFKYGATTIGSLDSSGNFTVIGNVISNGSL